MIGGGALAVLGAFSFRRTLSVFSNPLEFEALEVPVGFRRMAGGMSSSGFDPFFGLNTIAEPTMERALAYVKKDLSKSLFGSRLASDGLVQIASFSDFYCPYCRILTERLARLAAKSNGAVQITWHELPILGEASVLAAKAAIAADMQGAYLEFHHRLMKTPFRINAAYLEAVSDSIGLDHQQLLRDINSVEVRQQLDISAALARLFSFAGTPAIVVGRTVVQGEISEGLLDQLIERERDDGPIGSLLQSRVPEGAATPGAMPS